MEIKIKKGELIIRHKLKSSETYKLQKTEKSQSLHIFKKPITCKGFSSKTEDGYHIFLLDYDGVDKSVVIDDVRLLQTEEGLPPAYLFTTKKGNYHVIFLSKHPVKEIYDLMRYTSIDANFHDSPIRSKYRSWVLRIGGKGKRKRPKFLGILNIKTKPLSDFPISSAHKQLLSQLYKINHPNYGNLEDGLKIVKLQEYQTK